MKFKFDLKSDAKKMEKHLNSLNDKSLKRQMAKTIVGGDPANPNDDLNWSNDWSNLGWVNNWANNWRNVG
ncbi:hypothetical protein [Chryseobacterium gleum]|uniref:hypothetical protein n=1 Tax=Chryseobacterium gleum TaxID=250 RepID=UPI0031E03E6C